MGTATKIETVEFKGCDNLVIAKITTDNATTYETSAVESLAPLGEVAKTTETAKDSKYYDNSIKLTVRAEGVDTVTLNIPVLALSKLSKIIGKEVDATTGAFFDTEISDDTYFALGYRLKLSDGTYRYVWRLKGTFEMPDEGSQTQKNDTTTTGQSVVFTGITPEHRWTINGKSKTSKATVVDERDGLCVVTDFFEEVKTPENLTAVTTG